MTRHCTAARLPALALAAIVFSGCTGEGSPAASETPGSGSAAADGADAALTAVSCPRVSDRQQRNHLFRPDGADAPDLDAVMTVHRLSRRVYCVDAVDWEGVESIVEYQVEVEDNASNYGETYRVTDAEGSSELLHFPFTFTAHGGCRAVVATITLTERDDTAHTFTATGQAGPGCS